MGETAALALVAALVIAATVGTVVLSRRRYADTGLSEWRRDARRLSWSDRRVVGRAVRAGEAAPARLAGPAVQFGECRWP